MHDSGNPRLEQWRHQHSANKQIFNKILISVTVGVDRYVPEGRGSTCPSTATEISVITVPKSQVCTLHCANIKHCAGFAYNKQTGIIP